MLRRSIINSIWQNFNLHIHEPSTAILFAIIFSYLIYIFFFIRFNYQDILGHLGLLFGLIGLTYAKICADSSGEQLDKAQEGLNKIQLDYWITRGNDLYKEKVRV